jgi:hypothetical protein
MPDEKQENNTNPNTSPNNPDSQGWDNRDWRDRRREWRQQRREGRQYGPTHGLFWGLLLIMLGVLFFGNQQGWLEPDTWWHYLLVGLGAIFIINGMAHYWNPNSRHSSYGQFIPGVVLLCVGVAFILNFSQWWPMVLIAAGAAVLLGQLFHRS